MSALVHWFRSLLSKDRRKAARQSAPAVCAHYWSGTAQATHEVLNISNTGMYVKDTHPWFPGTQIMMSLQRMQVPEADPMRSVSVNAVVVRRDYQGMGVHFLHAETHRLRERTAHTALGATRPALQCFLNSVRSTSAQALVEYILVLPMVVLLIVNLVNFGGFFYAWITVANAARAGADYAVLGESSVGAMRAPSAAQIQSVITQDTSSLPNKNSVTVNVCQSTSSGVVTLSGTCTGIPSDPEAAGYTLTSIDVTYTYQPFIGAGFQFPNMNVYATIPPTTIRRRAVMRMIQ